MHNTSEIIEFLRSRFVSVEVAVSVESSISGPCSLKRPLEGGVCFFNKKRWQDMVIETEPVGLLLAAVDLEPSEREELIKQCQKDNTCLVFMEQPKSGLIAIVASLFTNKPVAGIHPSAIIDDTARIDPTALICAGAVIGPGVEIGAYTRISELVVVSSGAKIGAFNFISPGVKIGQAGFGYQRQPNGTMIHFPHIGSVIIGDHVEIGANTCIDRGTIDDTVIHDGVKIDNLCHISHNVEIQKDAVVIANSMIGGSVRVGPRAWLAPSVNVINGVSIGADVTVGMASTVIKPVTDDQTIVGSPAVALRDFVHERRVLKAMLEEYEKEMK